MVDRTTTVDVVTMEVFLRSLKGRLQDARTVLHRLTDNLQDRPATLGTFHDGLTAAQRYQSIIRQETDRVSRLVSALEAAVAATTTIISNYRTTEARNRANSADIAAVLGGVDTALEGGA